jgi:hypothetical protein
MEIVAQARDEFVGLYRELQGVDKRTPAAQAISASIRAAWLRHAEGRTPDELDLVEEARRSALEQVRAEGETMSRLAS